MLTKEEIISALNLEPDEWDDDSISVGDFSLTPGSGEVWGQISCTVYASAEEADPDLDALESHAMDAIELNLQTASIDAIVSDAGDWSGPYEDSDGSQRYYYSVDVIYAFDTAEQLGEIAKDIEDRMWGTSVSL